MINKFLHGKACYHIELYTQLTIRIVKSTTVRKHTMALDDRSSLSNSRMGRKNGKVCSITVIFSRNDLLSKTQWNISQGSPAKCTCSSTVGNYVFGDRDASCLFHPFWAKVPHLSCPIIQNITGLHVHSAKKLCYSLKWTFHNCLLYAS